jgi:hypothetical protein
MLAVSHGRMILLSTPYGRRGFFYNEWAKGADRWKRIEIAVDQCPRISAEYLAEALQQMGESWYRQEFHCSFAAMEGLVYPDFERCVVQADGVPEGRWFGGIDFGLRNPFAAVWGVLDRDDVLWLVGEHYVRDKSLAYHAQHLPRNVTWYGDPEGAREIRELHCAGFPVRKGDNARRPGIAAVRSRIETGRLKILDGACPNLVLEAQLYCYDEKSGDSENPLKQYDHALDALRYMISKLDYKKMALFRRGKILEPLKELLTGRPKEAPAEPTKETAAPPRLCVDISQMFPPEPTEPAPKKKNWWMSIHNEALWTRIG